MENKILVPATPGLVPLRLSVSKTKTFLDCKKKYEFTYIQKLPRKSQDFHVLGKLIHKALEDFHEYYLNGCTDPYNVSMTKAFKAGLEEFKSEMTPKIKKDAFDMINQYLKLVSEDQRKGTSANILSVERGFEILVDGKIVLNGAIDRIQLDPDGVVHVVDYKSTKNKKYLMNDFFQLLTYSYFIVTEDPSIEKVRASYMLMRHNFEYVTTEFSLDEILAVKDKFLNYAKEIQSEQEFAPNPTPLCSYCDHLNLCPEGKGKAFNANIFGEVNW